MVKKAKAKKPVKAVDSAIIDGLSPLNVFANFRNIF